MSQTFNERLRLIRFRRKRERAKFREELRVIPKWLVWTCVTLYFLALIIGTAVNLHNMQTADPIFPDDSFRSQPVFSCVALGAAITAAAVFVSIWLFMLGYVYCDAKRRDMHPGLWTLLVLILSPAYLFIGLIIYLLVREPLPFPCPRCATTVSARFNFCPNCKYYLHPACPQCQREVSDDDKFCPYCATELHDAPQPSADSAPSSSPMP
jgi:RNA polymerase subunit RPABC4/transcription elongation factor Spt4